MKSDQWNLLYRKQVSDEEVNLILSLVFPSFVEREGCVLLEEQLEDTDFQAIYNTHHGNKAAIEEAINAVDLTDLLNCVLPGDEFETLARQIAHLWKVRLQELFEGRHFEVEAVDFSGDGAWGITVKELAIPQNIGHGKTTYPPP